MPLAGEHIMIGLAVQQSQGFSKKLWKWQVIIIAILANAPDLDSVPGIIFYNDWGYYHRLATHSLLYSLSFGFFAALLLRHIFRRNFFDPLTASAIVFSHVLSDYLLSPWPVEFCWPFNFPPTYSHHLLLEYFGLTSDISRAWFIYILCFAYFYFSCWRDQNEFSHQARQMKYSEINYRLQEGS